MLRTPLYLSLIILFFVAGCASTDIIVVDQPAIRVSPSTEDIRADRQRTQPTMLRIGETEPIFGLDPLFAETNAAKRLTGLLYQGLTGLDSNGNIIPVLAESWEVTNDSLVYTFRLNKQATFTDSPRFIDGKGRRVLASDVKAAFERMAQPEVPAQASDLFAPVIQGMELFALEQRQLVVPAQRSVTNIQGIEVIDDHTIRFILNQKTPEFTVLLASPMASVTPRELSAQLNNHPVGSGPYALTSRQADTLFVLRYQPSFWQDDAGYHPAHVEVRRYDSETAILNALRSHLVDIAPNLSPLARMTALTREGNLNTEVLPEFNLITARGNDYLSLYHNPSDRLKLSRDEAGAILNILQPDTLASRFNHLGLTEIKRGLIAPSSDFSRLMIRLTDPSQPRATLSFFQSNYEGFLARTSHQLAQNEFPLAMVRSGVVSREITWFTRYYPNYADFDIHSPLHENELIRFSLTRTAVVHSRINNFSVNSQPWWLSLQGVQLDTTLSSQ